jgi:hypothetical protein
MIIPTGLSPYGRAMAAIAIGLAAKERVTAVGRGVEVNARRWLGGRDGQLEDLQG